MEMAPPADPSDGEVDLVRIGALRRPDFLRTFPRIFKGTHTAHPQIETARARRVEFGTQGAVHVMVDGEVLELDLHALEVVPGALRVMA